MLHSYAHQQLMHLKHLHTIKFTRLLFEGGHGSLCIHCRKLTYSRMLEQPILTILQSLHYTHTLRCPCVEVKHRNQILRCYSAPYNFEGISMLINLYIFYSVVSVKYTMWSSEETNVQSTCPQCPQGMCPLREAVIKTSVASIVLCIIYRRPVFIAN